MRTKIYVYAIFLTMLTIALLGMACAVGLFLKHAFLDETTRLALDQMAIEALPPDFHFGEGSFSARLIAESLRNLKAWAFFVVPSSLIVMGCYWREALFGGLMRRWPSVKAMGEGVLFLILLYWILLGTALAPFQLAPIEIIAKSESHQLLGTYDSYWVHTLLTWNGSLWGIMNLVSFVSTLIWFFRRK